MSMENQSVEVVHSDLHCTTIKLSCAERRRGGVPTLDARIVIIYSAPLSRLNWSCPFRSLCHSCLQIAFQEYQAGIETMWISLYLECSELLANLAEMFDKTRLTSGMAASGP